MLFHLPLLLNVPYQFIIQLPFSPNNHILQQANNSNLQADQLIFNISYKFTGWPTCFLFFLQVYRWTHIFSPFFTSLQAITLIFTFHKLNSQAITLIFTFPTNAYGIVPPPQWDRSFVGGAALADSLPTSSTVVDP